MSIMEMIISMAFLIISSLSLILGDDLITGKLPGQPAGINLTQRSGYVGVGDQGQRALFYYFVESETDPMSKPIVLWLTGGPGCSSVGVGAFSEHGPFWPRGNSLIQNNHSWHKEANMLYLESPAGVGFSYSLNQSFYSNIDDQMTAEDNMQFLEKWMATHPQYQNQDIYIAGESYGGHFVPQLANLILKSSMKDNLEGVLVGNPLLEFNTDFDSKAEFLWAHGILSDSTFEMSKTVCNFSRMRREHTNTGTYSPSCKMLNKQADIEIGKLVDIYDINLSLCRGTTSRLLHPAARIDICMTGDVIAYLNRKDVQQAIHAKFGEWNICSPVMHFYKMQELEVTSIPSFGALVKSGIRVLIYSGDQDAVLPFIGTRILVRRLATGLGFNITKSYRCWSHGRQQVGGWTDEYGGLITFATIKGAGHEAPFTQPERSLSLFTSFLQDRPLPMC